MPHDAHGANRKDLWRPDIRYTVNLAITKSTRAVHMLSVGLCTVLLRFRVSPCGPHFYPYSNCYQMPSALLLSQTYAADFWLCIGHLSGPKLYTAASFFFLLIDVLEMLLPIDGLVNMTAELPPGQAVQGEEQAVQQEWK